MFKASFPSASIFAAFLEAIAAVKDEASFQITPESMRTKVLDESCIIMVDAEIQSFAAETWELDSKEPMMLAINVAEALKVLGKPRRGESLTLLYNPEEHKVWLEVAGSERSRRLYVATLEESEIKAPALKLEFKARASLDPRALLEAVKDCKIFDSQDVRITIEPDAVSISSQGETGNALIKILKEGKMIYEIAADGRVSAKYSPYYLEKALRAGAPIGDKMVMIELNNNRPLKISFPSPSIKLEYYVAPRVE